VHDPTLVRGVPGRQPIVDDAGAIKPGGRNLEVREPSGRVRVTDVHAEIDREIRDFVRTNPTPQQYENFRQYLDWRWQSSYWESGAGQGGSGTSGGSH
jgi:hypothetical protein